MGEQKKLFGYNLAWWVGLMLRDRDRVKNVFSHLQNPKPGDKGGKMQTCACGVRVGVHATEHVRRRGNEALEYLQTINFTLISKCQNNEFCDFLAHRNQGFMASPFWGGSGFRPCANHLAGENRGEGLAPPF